MWVCIYIYIYIYIYILCMLLFLFLMLLFCCSWKPVTLFYFTQKRDRHNKKNAGRLSGSKINYSARENSALKLNKKQNSAALSKCCVGRKHTFEAAVICSAVGDLAWQLTHVACQAASPVTHPDGSGGSVGRRRHLVAASPDASCPSLSSVMAMPNAHARWYEPPP